MNRFKKTAFRFLPLVIFAALFMFFPKNAFALTCKVDPAQGTKTQVFTATISTGQTGKVDQGVIKVTKGGWLDEKGSINFSDQSSTLSRQVSLGSYGEGTYSVKVTIFRGSGAVHNGICEMANIFLVTGNPSSNPPKLEQPSSPITTASATLATLKISGLDASKVYQLHLSGKWSGGEIGDGGNNDWHAPGGIITVSNICENGNASRSNCTDLFRDGTYVINITEGESGPSPGSVQFEVKTGVTSGSAGGQNPCADPNNLNGPVTECPTAFGNIPTDPTAFVGRVLSIGIGIAGGIALIIMVYGSIKVLMSGGDPKKVADGRDMIVAAVSGLLFLILSVLILRFIGVTFLPINPFT